MRAVLPGRPPTKLQALCTAFWEDLRIVAYISGNALIILGGPQQLIQTIYVEEVETLESIAIEDEGGKIAVCGGSHVYIYKPYGKGDGALKWSLAHTFEDQDCVHTLSWGSTEELLVGSSFLSLLLLDDVPRVIWTQKLANAPKIVKFSYDGAYIASTGTHDRLVKIWRRLAFGEEDSRFDVSYLNHPASVTAIHWRQPRHREQRLDNIVYTICADNKIRIWAVNPHGMAVMRQWGDIDMSAVIQPRFEKPSSRRFGFFIDSRDFQVATEHAVQRTGKSTNRALEHLLEMAQHNPEICVILDDDGHMSAWGLEDVGCKGPTTNKIINISHIEGLEIAFGPKDRPAEEYATICAFGAEKLTILAHHFDGRIEWLDTEVEAFFDPSPRKNRLSRKAVWSGHSGPIKKIVRNVSGRSLISRTSDNKGLIWRQRSNHSGSGIAQTSTLLSEEHIHRTCLIDDGSFVMNLHHDSVSLWDTRSSVAVKVASCPFSLSGRPLCILVLPHATSKDKIYVATIGADMDGIAWEISLPRTGQNGHSEKDDIESAATIKEFATFNLGFKADLHYVLPVDPAGSLSRDSGALDIFAQDVALAYTKSGSFFSLTARVDTAEKTVQWLRTSTIETSIENPSLASGSSIRKTAVVDSERTGLTIWDNRSAQLEFEEHFSLAEAIQDLDWTSTPDSQSILAVGFPHRVLLLTQLRYDYVDAGPAWAAIREIRIRDLTPHPIGDSCWLGNGNLVVGAGNQLFAYDREVDLTDRLVSDVVSTSRIRSSDLFQIVSRLNGPLPVFHPQLLAQCILAGKTDLVHYILTTLHRKLKFYSEGDELDGFLEIPASAFSDHEEFTNLESSTAEITEDDRVVDENVAAILNDNLTRKSLPQLSSHEQFQLADIIECVATVEKHRRSMDDNAARYLLFFRQYIMRNSKTHDKLGLSWREIVWAYHSGSQDILVDLVSRQFNGKMLWTQAQESGMFMWLTDLQALRSNLEIIARNEYTKTDEKNPIDCSLFYLALRKKNILQGLWRMATWNREQGATTRLLANNFQEARWKTAALKNAYALLGKRRFQYAAAFFLLADRLHDAANVCCNQLDDIQLAIAISRAYEGDDGPVVQELIETKVLPKAVMEGDRWLASWAFWMLRRRDLAVRATVSPLESLHTNAEGQEEVPLQAKSYLANDPALVVLYRQLREKTLQALKGASKIPARDEWEFVIRNARLYDRMGCDLLALDLVKNWEFLQADLKPESDVPNPRKLLRRRSSLVAVDMPLSPGLADFKTSVKAHPAKPPPTVFEEPDASSLLDSFGF